MRGYDFILYFIFTGFFYIDVCKGVCDDNSECLNGGYCTPFFKICACSIQFTGSNCEKAKDLCDNSDDRCLNGGTCATIFGTCTCTSYYTGRRCELANKCDDNAIVCKNQGTCINGACTCKDGFNGTFCEIATKCDQNIMCYNGGTCENGTCSCTLGYNGTFCEIDTLSPTTTTTKSSNTGCVRSCKNGYCEFNKCVCNSDFTGDSCDIPSDRCQGDDPCLNGGVCSVILGTCKCSTHYTGKRCETAKPCDDAEVLCKNGGKCDNEECNCPNGFEGKFCESVSTKSNVSTTTLAPHLVTDSCLQHTCYNGGTCKNLLNFHSFCVCKPGFSGPTCNISETNRNDTVQCGSKICQNGAKCKDYINVFFKCECADGFTGTLCENAACDNIKEICLNGGTCNNKKCACTESYKGDRCQTVKDCDEMSELCHNNGNCAVKDGKHVCVCEKGYTGTFCENVKDCEDMSELCYNNGNCAVNDGTHVCVCKKGYTGTFCENGLPDSQRQKSKAELTRNEKIGLIVGLGTFGAIILIVIIGFAVFKRRRPLKSLSSDCDNIAFSDVMKKEGRI